MRTTKYFLSNIYAANLLLTERNFPSHCVSLKATSTINKLLIGNTVLGSICKNLRLTSATKNDSWLDNDVAMTTLCDRLQWRYVLALSCFHFLMSSFNNPNSTVRNVEHGLVLNSQSVLRNDVTSYALAC